MIALSPDDGDGLHLLAKQLTAISEYGQAARLYGRLARLQPDNDQYPLLQSEMQRLADEEAAQKAAKKSGPGNGPKRKGVETHGDVSVLVKGRVRG